MQKVDDFVEQRKRRPITRSHQILPWSMFDKRAVEKTKLSFWISVHDRMMIKCQNWMRGQSVLSARHSFMSLAGTLRLPIYADQYFADSRLSIFSGNHMLSAEGTAELKEGKPILWPKCLPFFPIHWPLFCRSREHKTFTSSHSRVNDYHQHITTSF